VLGYSPSAPMSDIADLDDLPNKPTGAAGKGDCRKRQALGDQLQKLALTVRQELQRVVGVEIFRISPSRFAYSFCVSAPLGSLNSHSRMFEVSYRFTTLGESS
jgi:hypothetical protein